MAKGKSSGKFMDNAVGMCAYKDGTMSDAARTSRRCGPGMNADQQKADRLLQKAHKQWDSLRGKGVM